MAKLVKIGERIINLDQIAFAERTTDGEGKVVRLIFECDPKPIDRRRPDDPSVFTLNMGFEGTDAKFVWEKISKFAEVWGLPSEIEPEKE